jgi:tetratricopeptide (TPR) repeat protein
MPRHKKREEHGPERDWESRPASVQAAEPGETKGRVLRAGVVLLVLLAGVGAVLLVSGRHKPRRPNAIADKADEARPEVAVLLREASRVVDRLLDRFPDSPDALDAVAWAYRRFGQTQEAVAWAYRRFGQTQEAVTYWERCLQLDPGSMSAYYSLGLIAQTEGDLAKAVDDFRKAAQLDPQSSRHAVAWAESLMNMGELDEAARVLEKDLQVHPKSVPSVILAGQVYVRLRQYEKARQYLETAVEMAPDYTSAYYGLGTACAKLGDRE